MATRKEIEAASRRMREQTARYERYAPGGKPKVAPVVSKANTPIAGSMDDIINKLKDGGGRDFKTNPTVNSARGGANTGVPRVKRGAEGGARSATPQQRAEMTKMVKSMHKTKIKIPNFSTRGKVMSKGTRSKLDISNVIKSHMKGAPKPALVKAPKVSKVFTTAAKIAKPAAKLLGRAAAPVGIAMAAYDVYKAARPHMDKQNTKLYNQRNYGTVAKATATRRRRTGKR